MTNQAIIQQIIESVFFKNATKKAGKYTKNVASIVHLLKLALQKLTGDQVSKSIPALISEKFQLIVRMLKAYSQGSYRVLPLNSVIKLIAALVYFVSPLDFIPDLLPVIGLSDDIAVVLWVLKSIEDDVENFKQWEAGILK